MFDLWAARCLRKQPRPWLAVLIREAVKAEKPDCAAASFRRICRIFGQSRGGSGGAAKKCGPEKFTD
ncbi:hypothetical protein [Gemmobacter caeruleus]|uniref:hypothetical protein n=1 Tax=Gemmobacter caeruleus TaxID=2595004 RepID=UPI0011EE111C|nr:hypothetical protein [Gemmobacter caeruleus]